MGRIVLVARLAAKDLLRRPAQVLLTLLAIAAATATLTLGLALHGVTSQPYQQTRAATNGPDVVAPLAALSVPGQPGQGSPGPQVLAEASALVRAPGVTGHSGPFPVTFAILRAGGRTALVQAQGRGQAAAVDQPKLTAGSWVQPGGIVLERAFAEALGAGAGDRVTLNGRRFTVAGIAVTAASPPYPHLCNLGCAGDMPPSAGGIPASDIGLGWVTGPDARAVASAAGLRVSYVLNLKLRDPAAASAFASGQGGAVPAVPDMVSWQSIRAVDGLLVQDEQQVLTPGAWLLGLLAVASMAVLVGGRMAEQTRRAGLIKAAGGTPGLVAGVLLAEHLALALAAAAAGLAAGWLVAPLLTNPGAALIGSPGAPSLSPATIGLVVAAGLAVALAATLVPALRAARTSTVAALADAPRPPRRQAALIAISRRLPAPLLVGLRLIARRPRRLWLSAASIAVTVAGIVALLVFRATAAKMSLGTSPGLSNPVADRDSQVLLVITVMLVVLAAINAIFTTWATAQEARHASALVRALGLTPRQASAGISAAQVLPALPGALLGVPLGIALFAAANGGGTATTTIPPAWQLAATVLGAVLAVVGLASIPATISARLPVAVILQSETA